MLYKDIQQWLKTLVIHCPRSHGMLIANTWLMYLSLQGCYVIVTSRNQYGKTQFDEEEPWGVCLIHNSDDIMAENHIKLSTLCWYILYQSQHLIHIGCNFTT